LTHLVRKMPDFQSFSSSFGSIPSSLNRFRLIFI
jgi:hypothetical protein